MMQETTQEGGAFGIIQVESRFYRFGTYSGDWDSQTNEPHGQGQWKRGGVLRFDGGWEQGVWNGIGTVFDENTGLKYCTGNFLNGKLHGLGKIFATDGETIEEESFHLFGEEMPTIRTEEEFQAKATEILQQKEEAAKVRQISSVFPSFSESSNTSISFTLDSSNPIMTAPIVGLFPRYTEVPSQMLQGVGFGDLSDEDIPTPTNLEEGKTREDWLAWIRNHYPRK